MVVVLLLLQKAHLDELLLARFEMARIRREGEALPRPVIPRVVGRE